MKIKETKFFFNSATELKVPAFRDVNPTEPEVPATRDVNPTEPKISKPHKNQKFTYFEWSLFEFFYKIVFWFHLLFIKPEIPATCDDNPTKPEVSATHDDHSKISEANFITNLIIESPEYDFNCFPLIKELDEITKNLIKLRIEPSIGDGSCGYRSISNELLGNQNGHLLVRHSTIQFMETYRLELIKHYEGEKRYLEILNHIKTKNSWIDIDILSLLSFQLKVNFDIYMDGNYQVNDNPVTSIWFGYSKTINLRYKNIKGREHYDLLVPQHQGYVYDLTDQYFIIINESTNYENKS